MPVHIQEACQILGVHWNDPDLASSAKRAYRQLAKELHPDKTREDTAEKFNSVNDAYTAVTEFLKNPIPAPLGGFGGMHINVGGMGSVPNGGTVHQHVDPNGNVIITFTMGGPMPR